MDANAANSGYRGGAPGVIPGARRIPMDDGL
jgi:hypothetical protein